MKSTLLAVVFAALAALTTTSALAQDDPGEGGRAAVEHAVSLTFSPIHLILPVFEVTGEFAVAPKISLAAILGVGSVSSDGISATVFEVGGQFAYYLVGNFDHGMQLGAEVLYLGLSGDDVETSGTTAVGLAVGPFVGYKLATDFGFTFMAQLGVEYVVARAESSSSSSSEKSFIPLLNLNIGWSF